MSGESEILGFEVVGIVIEVVDDVNYWKVGDNVFGLVVGGGYVEEVVVLSFYLMLMLEVFSFVEVVGLVEVFLIVF